MVFAHPLTPGPSSLDLPEYPTTLFGEAALERGCIERGLARQQLCRRAGGRHGSGGVARDGADIGWLGARGAWRDGEHIVEAERGRMGRLAALPRRHDDENLPEALRGLPQWLK